VLSEVYLKSSERPIDQSNFLLCRRKFLTIEILHRKKVVDEQVTINSGKAF